MHAVTFSEADVAMIASERSHHPDPWVQPGSAHQNLRVDKEIGEESEVVGAGERS